MRAGDFVRVLPWKEVRCVLDACGCTAGLPFMPEMVDYCGRVFRVARRADRICIPGHFMGMLENCVILEGPRCDGRYHDGCGRRCALIWHETWLERVEREWANGKSGASSQGAEGFREGLKRWTRDGARYRCQSTSLPGIARGVKPWHLSQYLVDLRSGQVGLIEQIGMMVPLAYKLLCRLVGMNWWPAVTGSLEKTPAECLDLKPGEWVRLKSRKEIAKTLDAAGRNRGLEFSPEMERYCGRRFRVLSRVDRIILEHSGEMRELENTVLLDGLTCSGRYKVGCPRNEYLYCREIWLERVDEKPYAAVEGA